MKHNLPNDPVAAILALHGIPGPYAALEATGVASLIYATQDLVIKVATSHAEAIEDARTESVAAPAAFRAGIRTPRLVAFDDSGLLWNGPYSIWERVHAQTLGLLQLQGEALEYLWWQVGRELFLLHSQVISCPDRDGYLDTPGREAELNSFLRRLADSGRVSAGAFKEIELLIQSLTPFIPQTPSPCFLHNDLHQMNVMCTHTGELAAIIDWGDAGWGDAALDFAAIPLEQIPSALAGYGRENLSRLGHMPQARFIWDRLPDAIDLLIEGAGPQIPVTAYRAFLDQF